MSENVDDARFEIMPGLVHVWDAVLSEGADNYPDFNGILDPTERRRAERFQIEQHRIRFIICRGWLRLLLSAYTGRSPWDIELVLNEYGKPKLAGNPVNTGLVFNLSHSAERMVFAFAKDCMLGIDIEAYRNLTRPEGMVERICCAREILNWQKRSADRRLQYFFSIWVRKEAIIKAQGQGISLGMEHCELSENLGRPVRLPESCGRAGEWTLLDLSFREPYWGAVAVNGLFKSLVRRDLPEKLLLQYLKCAPG